MASGLSRVTVVAPRRRVDLALPSDVPLADLLPVLLSYAGPELADDQAARGGWTLSRLGGATLDSSHTPAQLEVRDGELLYLRPRGDDAPKMVFDDVVDAVATATRDRAGRWNPAATRAFGLTLGVLALLCGAVAVLLAGPPQLPGGLIGLGLAVALLVLAVIFARVVGDTRSATAFALVASVYAGVGGLLVLAGDRTVSRLTAAHVLVAVTAVLLTTAVAAVGVADAAPIFLGCGIVVGAVLVTAMTGLVFGVAPPAAAAVTVAVALAMLPALPMFAYRLGRLPIPTVPTERTQLRQDTEQVDGVRVLDLSERADSFLAALLGALALIGGGAAVVVARDGTRGLALCLAIGLLLLARARWFLSRAQRLPLLAAGILALGAAAVTVFGRVGHVARLTAILGAALALAAVSVGFGLAGARRRASPVWGRILDILEVLLILTVVPLAVWVSGLYAWIRSIRG